METGETFCGECGRQSAAPPVHPATPDISYAAAPQAPAACAYCGTAMTAGKQFCGSCGKPAAGAMRSCPSCGARLALDRRFCEDCGASVEPRPFAAAAPVWPQSPPAPMWPQGPPPASMPAPMAQQSGSGARPLIAIVVIVVLAAAGYVAYRLIAANSPSTPTETVKAFFTAMANDDREGLKKLLTKKALVDGASSLSQPVPDAQRNLARSALAAGFRNEKVFGDQAIIEAKIDDSWEAIALAKEDGKWKINGPAEGGH
jgi:hypothetical protein